ncbi:MAG: DUF3108 domain-containing protein [Acidobacteriaceae bacterium]|nr:DUF3108 domain-containing protein [Acidobacteriaceae bacterium]
MNRSGTLQRFAGVVSSLLLLSFSSFAPAGQLANDPQFPYPERLTYSVEWRMLAAGEAVVELKRSNPQAWNISLNLASAGLVSRLYRVADSYRASTSDRFCGANAFLDAQEGKKHLQTSLTFDNPRHKVDYDERDLVRNTTAKKQLDIAPCTYEITGAFTAMRLVSIEPGQTVTLPITDGKKMAYAKVQAQGKENITVSGKSYATVRYEAFLFDNVLYKRKGRLFIWLTDDAERLPVQFRMQMGFPIGTITVELEKKERL